MATQSTARVREKTDQSGTPARASATSKQTNSTKQTSRSSASRSRSGQKDSPASHPSAFYAFISLLISRIYYFFILTYIGKVLLVLLAQALLIGIGLLATIDRYGILFKALGVELVMIAVIAGIWYLVRKPE